MLFSTYSISFRGCPSDVAELWEKVIAFIKNNYKTNYSLQTSHIVILHSGIPISESRPLMIFVPRVWRHELVIWTLLIGLIEKNQLEGRLFWFLSPFTMILSKSTWNGPRTNDPGHPLAPNYMQFCDSWHHSHRASRPSAGTGEILWWQ